MVLALIARRSADARPLQVIDTHAGAGLYDLADDMARRSGEAEAGIGRLMADAEAPAAFDGLKAAVAGVNREGALRRYPGSPLLVTGVLRRGDRYAGYELREDDRDALRALLRGEAHRSIKAEVILGDGYAALASATALEDRQTAYLIDPPFERGDEYDQVTSGVAAVLRADPTASIAVWVPLKDLETFDGLLRRLEALKPARLQVAETRLRPLANPMKMNGCAMVLLNAPDVSEEAGAAADWIAAHCGEAGARGRVYDL